VTDKEFDLVETMIRDWRRERPDLDATPLGVVGRVINIAGLLHKRITNELGHYGLNYSEFDILATLRRSGEPYKLNPTELMKSVLLTSGAITAAVERLTNKGLTCRQPSENDGRVKSVMLTKKGLILIEEALATRFREADSAIEGLTVDEAKMLANLLKKLSLAIN
jgi:DNA-binding MarR family transcriptional regulator